MQTLAKFTAGLKTIPAGVTWYLADIAEAKGKQDLYTNQSPQKLIFSAFILSGMVNGRVSRLLLLLQLYQAGYEVGRYISIERLIEEHKERYYETLEISSQQWHDGKHDPWLYVNFLLYILKKSYSEFIERMKKIETRKGAKTELVIEQIQKMNGEFTLSQLQSRRLDVSRDMVRKVLKDLQKQGKVVSEGRGLGARWRRKGNILL